MRKEGLIPGVIMLLFLSSCKEKIQVRPPNILLIMADDLGYGDVGFNGGKIPTPHIDSLAKNGMVFEQGYVTAPQCAPSRAALLTGRYQQKFGFEVNFEVPGPSGDPYPGAGLPVGERTMADFLRAAGYHTGVIGKWHLGEEPQFHPLQRGFDEFFGFLGGLSPYMGLAKPSVPGTWDWCDLANADVHTVKNRMDRRIPNMIRNNSPAKVTSYLTDALGEEACSFMERNKDKTWFLYLAFNAPHTPIEATPKYLERFPDIADPMARTYAAMVSALDDAVGRTLQTLQDLNLEQRTLVVFLSDNGAPLRVVPSASNAPLRGEKGDVLEGGVRVPFVARWNGHIPAGVKIHAPVSALDLLPTFLALSGNPPSPEAKLDGENLMETLLLGKQPTDQRSLYWAIRYTHADPNTRPLWGIRKEAWKLLQDPDASKSAPGSPALFNIEADIHEDHDLSADHPKIRKELAEDLQQWTQTLQPPRWGNFKGKPFQAIVEPQNPPGAKPVDSKIKEEGR